MSSLWKKQISLLERIAKADDRRLEDLVNLLFSCGLSVYFCERSICICKNEDEYTDEEIKQKSFNDKLLKDNPKFFYQSSEEQKAQGYEYVDSSFNNYNRRGFYSDLDQRYHRVDKDSFSIRFHDSQSEEVVWYAFSRFNRSNTPQDQAEVNELINKALNSFKN